MVLEQNAETMMQKQLFNAAIMTPYLTHDFTTASGCTDCPANKKCEEEQKKYGYDPKNIITAVCLDTPKTTVRLRTVESIGRFTRDDLIMRTIFLDYPEQNRAAHLVISGSTEDIENFIFEKLKETGLIIARYSIFYGGPSEYTGRLAEQSGYSLDIPKSVAAAKALLTNDAVLDAIIAREENKIRHALRKLNKSLEQPIVVTPYLKKALEYNI